MNFSKEYEKLFLEFVAERKLDLDDESWPEQDYKDFSEKYAELLSRFQAEIAENLTKKSDEEYEEDFYKIDMIVDTEDGPEYETVDVRKMSLKQLSSVCNMFPKYNQYYFKRVKESL